MEQINLVKSQLRTENDSNRSKYIDMAKDIAIVRETGATNMFFRSEVARVLTNIGLYTTASYILENPKEYIALLELSGKY